MKRIKVSLGDLIYYIYSLFKLCMLGFLAIAAVKLMPYMEIQTLIIILFMFGLAFCFHCELEASKYREETKVEKK